LLGRKQLQIRRGRPVRDVVDRVLANGAIGTGAFGPQPIDGAAAGQRQEPRGHRTALYVVARRLCPRLGERLEETEPQRVSERAQLLRDAAAPCRGGAGRGGARGGGACRGGPRCA
jgi:hypothetical protein